MIENRTPSKAKAHTGAAVAAVPLALAALADGRVTLLEVAGVVLAGVAGWLGVYVAPRHREPRPRRRRRP